MLRTASSDTHLSPSASDPQPTSSQFKSRRAARRRTRTGFTLLEVMIATAATLLMMVSLAQIFKVIGDSMKQGRAALELNNRLRSVVYRIRTDLENITAIPDPPADPASGLGYLKIYDGSMTDYSAAQYSAGLNSDTDLTNDVPDISRFGDLDDVIMFTARAGDVWYTGKVPLFVLRRGYTGAADDLDLVTIAAQHAEIVIFAEPLVSNLVDGTIDNSSRDVSYLIKDPNNYAAIPGTDIPANLRLHYRTLLIRPDLNLNGALPSTAPGAGDPWMRAQPTRIVAGGNTYDLPSPTCDMSKVHQQCDLSVRRVDLFASSSAVAANSLEDLVDPANRFGHVQIPLSAQTLSMPILALSPKMSMPHAASDAGATTINPNNQLAASFQSGFLHPAFTLFLYGRTGEDILASDILAFDVKAYDPGVPLLALDGPDGVPGTATAQPPGSPVGDDDADGTANNASERGWAGSDDLILSPNDPGYGPALAAGAVVIGSGEYVDIGWGWKTRSQSAVALLPAANTSSPLSGMRDPASWTALSPFTDALYKSGLVVHPGTPSAPIIFQPAYDTWTTRYEGDGILQGEPAGGRGLVWVANAATGPLMRENWRGTGGSYVIDAGTDGIDNNGNGGVDEAAELETSPPFPTKLRGLKISIRMEDPASRLVKQMSVAKEFVTQ